jgi:hypothetical protein
MPIEANARITLRGGPESLKVLQGVRRGTSEASKEAKKASQESERAAKATARAAEAAARAQQKASRDAAKAAEKASRDAVRAAEQGQKAVERLAQKEADRWQQLARQSARVREAAQQAATRAAQREAAKQIEIAKKTSAAEAKARAEGLRRAGGLVGAATAGVLAGGMSAVSTARGIAGSQDIGQRIQNANQFRERLVIATNAAGMTPEEREQTQGKVTEASKATGKDIGEMMSVLETGQAQFNNLRFFADNLKEIAIISKAAGADTGQFATALGFVQKAFGLSGEEAMEAAYLMKASADVGSVELADFARDFAASAGIFAQNTKQTGMGGVRQFLGTAQGIGTGGFGSAESATRLERLITDLNDVEVQKGLKKIGVKNIATKEGKIDIGNVLTQLGQNKQFEKASVRQDIFKDVRGLQAVETLVTAQNQVRAGATGAVDFKTISGVDAAAGRTATAKTFEAMQGEGFFKMQQEAAKMQADTVENLGSYNKQVLAVTEVSNRLEKSFGALSIWAGSIATMGLVGAGTSMLGKLAGAGGDAAAGGGALAKAIPTVAGWGSTVAGWGAGALAAGGTAVGAASGAALAGTVGAGLAIGGVVGTGINEVSGMMSSDDKRISDRLADAIFEMIHGSQTQTQAIKETNRKLDSVDAGLRANVVKPAAPAAREPR